MRDFLKKIARKPLVARLTDWLAVRGILLMVYRFLFAPRGGKHEISVAGRRAQFYVYSEDEVRTLDFGNGEFPMLEFLIAGLTPGDCFYDIGAATGWYTVLLAQVVGEKGRVIAFEPQRDVYGRLLENVKLNELRNVQAFRLALSDRDGSATLQTGGVACAGRIVSPGKGPRMFEEHVQIFHGDRFVERQILNPPKAVKIDVEGHEYSVLQGLNRTLSQPSCEILCCEIHPRFLPQTLKLEDFLSLLRSVGFSEIQIHPRGDDLHVWASKHK
ncbi:MAG: FkbM family methyltransferase [Acidobacteriia bacterium]|nr:FkbM family methyltransferase [Terriglobia bacterium]